jgi:signal transduction histidine kinase
VGVFGLLLLDLRGHSGHRQRLPTSDGSTLEILATDGAALSVTDVAALPHAQWRAWPGRGFAPGQKRGQVAWARVRLSNPGAETMRGVLADAQHFADVADCFRRSEAEASSWERLRSGEWTPAEAKAIWGRENAFPVSIPARSVVTVYLRYEDFFGVWMEVDWWPQEAEFYAAEQRATLAEGLYFGTLLALLFYNAMLWLKLRLTPTGSYLLYLGSFALFMAFARSTPQLLGWSVGSPWMEALMTSLLSASPVFLLSFAEGFLELRTYLPRTLRWVRGLQGMMAAAAFCSLFSPWLGLTAGLMFPVLACVLVHLVILVLALVSRRAGAAQASYLGLAIGLLFAGFCPAVATWLDVLPLGDASRVVMAGSAMEMLLLAVIVSDRIGLLQQEKIAVQKALLVEAEQRETLQEAYADDLALEVRERTAELQMSNADKDRILAVLGHDQRGPLTGLTRSAEHWAERSAGDAALQHFVANAALTGRSLLLLIEDLVMWARLRAGTGHRAAHSLGALASPVLALHRLQAEGAGITLKAAVPDEVKVRTDLVPVQALLRNLLANALRAARQEVRVEAVQFADRVRFSVHDDGPGLPAPLAAAFAAENPEQLPNLHGLGLRLCLEISRALDLQLNVVSTGSGGTEFRFHLLIEPA